MMLVEADRPPVEAGDGSDKVIRTPIEIFSAVIALLIPVAFVTGLDADSWSLRTAILLVVAGVGLPILLSQVRGPNPLAARAAAGFLAFGSASAILSHNHTTAVFGLYNQGTGLLFMAGIASAWAIGRSLHPEARPMLENALIVGIGLSVGIALLASVVDLSRVTPDLFDTGGRLSGLANNPVHLAAMAVLGVALVVPRLAAWPAKWALTLPALAAAAQLSGTRGAIIVMAGIAIWAGRRHGIRIAVMLALLLIIGVAAGSVIGPSSSTSGATARASDLGDWRARPDTWLSARHSIGQNPLLGIGPGQFRTATSPYRPISIGRLGPETLFSDAHNIFVEYATTTGLLGVAALLVWLFAAVRPARGWLLVGALGVLVIHLFEPQSVASTPLAFLALGAAAPLARVRPRPLGLAHWLVPAVAITATVTLASAFLYGEYKLKQARLDLASGPAQQANRVLPAWPETASLLARIWLFTGITNHRSQADYQRSRSWRLVAVHRDETDPGLWNNLAEFDESQGQNVDAEREYSTALRLNPTSVRAMKGLAREAGIRCDLDQQRYWRHRFLTIAPAAGGSPADTATAATVAPTPSTGSSGLQPAPAVCAGPAHT